MNISILRKSLAIGTVLTAGFCSTALGGSVLFEGDYAPQNWSTAFFNAGWLPLNSQTITPSSGDASTVTFGWDYGYYGNGGAGFGNTFTFFTTATGNDELSFHWVDNAFAAWYMANQTAVAFYNDQFGYHSIVLGWNTSGDATMTVASGYTFGFSITSGNYDYDSRLIGTLEVTSTNNVPDGGNTTTLLGLALLGFAALHRKNRRA
jgi:hypothetical protein